VLRGHNPLLTVTSAGTSAELAALNADLLRRARLQAGRRRKVLRAFVRITQVQKQVAMDAFREGVAAAHHPIQPSGKLAKIGVVIFPAHFCRDRGTKLRIAMNAREFVSGISGDRNETEPRSLA
jgi:hypothetical protein